MLEDFDSEIERVETIIDYLKKQSVEDKAKRILESVKENHPNFYKQELVYQNYKSQFSEAYFSGSPWNVGDSYTEWYLSKPYTYDEKFTIKFYIILSCILNSLNKNTQNK